MTDFLPILQSYMREYDYQRNLSVGSSLEKAYDFCEDVLGKTVNKGRKTSDKQLDSLRNTYNHFDTYVSTSRALGRDFRERMVSLYQNLEALLNQCENVNGKLTAHKSRKTLALKYLGEGRLMFPHFLYVANKILKELESRNVDVSTVQERYDELSEL